MTTDPNTNGSAKGYEIGRHHQTGRVYFELDWEGYKDDRERRSAVVSLQARKKDAPEKIVVWRNEPLGAIPPLGSMIKSEAENFLNPVFDTKGREASPANSLIRMPTLLDGAEFFSTTKAHEFIIDEMMVAGQTMVVAALPKNLKTWLVIHAAVSIGLGRKFLGKFPTQKRRVALLSGESGIASVQEVARHAAFTMGADVEDADVFWATQLPNLITEAARRAFAELLAREEIDVCILDPAYMCLPVDGAKGQNPANVLYMANLLADLSGIVKRAGATLLIVHHFKKSNGTDQYQPADLGQTAMSGFAEVAGQWWLLSRRERYQCDGNHQLWLSAGCRAGHGDLYALDVKERAASDGVGRTWETSVRNGHELEREKRVKREQKKADRDQQKHDGILEALTAHPGGETKSTLRGELGCSSTVFDKAFKPFIDGGFVEPCKVLKSGREWDGWRLNAKGLGQTREFGLSGLSDVPVEPDKRDKSDDL